MELVPSLRDQGDWQLVLRTNRHLVVHNPASNEVILRANPMVGHTRPSLAPPHDPTLPASISTTSCPYCGRPWTQPDLYHDQFMHTPGYDDSDADNNIDMIPHYFRLLSETSATSTPKLPRESPDILQEQESNEGYYAKYFVELGRLGRGARGSVYLCQHVLHGHALGKYAVKKIPVGRNTESLRQSLQEVQLMEGLIHPNVIHYKHAWVETAQASPFAPRVPTLYVLMMVANGGSLADWIAARAGDPTVAEQKETSTMKSGRVERLKSEFRRRRGEARRGETSGQMGVHFLREDEVVQLMRDIAQGLAFLHDHNILHLDLKPGNVLLHWDDDALLPTAMLGDFGSSLPVQACWQHHRTGHTGTMEYMPPEVFQQHNGVLAELSSKADIWSLGILFHLLLFFELPYAQVDDIDLLREEILTFTNLSDKIRMRGLSKRFDRIHPSLAQLMMSMLDIDPQRRPTCHEILHALALYPTDPSPASEKALAVPTHRRTSSTEVAIPARPPHVPLMPASIPLRLLCWNVMYVYLQLALIMPRHRLWPLWLQHTAILLPLLELTIWYVQNNLTPALRLGPHICMGWIFGGSSHAAALPFWQGFSGL